MELIWESGGLRGMQEQKMAPFVQKAFLEEHSLGFYHIKKEVLGLRSKNSKFKIYNNARSYLICNIIGNL